VQRLRALDAINEQAQTLALADAASVMRLSLAHTEILDEATQLYLRDRDRESYQPPEERARIATLNELALPLMQLILDLRVSCSVSARASAGTRYRLKSDTHERPVIEREAACGFY
jgi:hypothetical protein